MEKSKGQRFAIVILEMMFELQLSDIIEAALALNFHCMLVLEF